MIRLDSVEDAAVVAPIVDSHLNERGLIAYPTETVFGLGGLIDDESVSRLIALKTRPPEQPFLILVSGLQMLKSLGFVLEGAARELAQRFWPGPLTLILPCPTKWCGSKRLYGSTNGIAVRWTSHAPLARLIELLKMPLTSTSANRSGEPSALSAEKVREYFPVESADGRLLIVDGPSSGNSLPSTLIDCTGARPRLLRRGAISSGELGDFDGEIV